MLGQIWLCFMMTDVWERVEETETEVERGLDTWRVFELIGTEASGPLKNTREEGCL